MKSITPRKDAWTRGHPEWSKVIVIVVITGLANILIGDVLHGIAGPRLLAVVDFADGVPRSALCGLIGALVLGRVSRHSTLTSSILRGAKVYLSVVLALTVVILANAIAGMDRDLVIAVGVSIVVVSLAYFLAYRHRQPESP